MDELFESPIAVADRFFVGCDKQLQFEVLAEGADPTNAHAVALDVSAMALAWALAPQLRGVPHTRAHLAAVVTKASGSGITVTGTFNADRALNTQRVVVAIAAADTAAFAAGNYVHALRRTDVGSKNVLASGAVALLDAP